MTPFDRRKMAPSSSPSPPPPPPPPPPHNRRWNYDVFLSFRGEDTRTNFTDHLYSALISAGIITFRDDERLERGKVINSELIKAIEESRVSIVVFSEGYASSKWCLDELDKIVECRSKIYQTVLPIFYHIDPSDVRRGSGSFAKTLAGQERLRCSSRKSRQLQEEEEQQQHRVMRWRASLREAGGLAGFHIKDSCYET